VTEEITSGDVMRVTTEFEYGGEKYEPNAQLEAGKDVPVKVAESVLEKGAAEKIAEGLEEEEEIDLDIGEEEEDEEIEFEKESEASSKEDEIFDAMDEDLDQSGQLPPVWSASMSDDNSEVTEVPEPNPIKGKVVRTGKGQYNKFVVIEDTDGVEHTIYGGQKALKSLVHTANEVFTPNETLYAAARFDGMVEKSGGQNYLAYSTALRNEDGEKIGLQEPENED